MSVDLCNIQMDYVKINVQAEIEDGCLAIKGQETAAGNEDVLYDSLFEFRYRFNTENTAKLWDALSNNKAVPLLDLVAEKFGGFYGCEKLRDFCKEKAVKYSFTSNTSYD